MEQIHGMPVNQRQLAGVVRSVRLRWRLRHAIAGATITVVLGFLLIAGGAYAMQAFKYAEPAVLSVRMVAALALLGIVYWFVVKPFLVRAEDAQVALYVEEHEPSLDGALVTAVEVGSGAHQSVLRSPALAARLVRAAIDGVRRVRDGRRVDSAGLQRQSVTLALVIAASLVAAFVGPRVLRHGMQLLLMPWRPGTTASAYSIHVTPGNATIARGGDQLVAASLSGFGSDRVDLLFRDADSSQWRRVSMTGDSAGRFSFRLFDVSVRTDYAVEASGIRSGVYRLNVAALPYVKKVDLQYRFPTYTQLAPLSVDSTGDIAALKGTMVRVRVAPTLPTTGGRVIMDGGDTLPLSPTADGRLLTVLKVERPGFYKIELQGPDGRMVTGSLDYTIDVLPDRPHWQTGTRCEGALRRRGVHRGARRG